MAKKKIHKRCAFGGAIAIALLVFCYVNIRFNIYAINVRSHCAKDNSIFSIMTFNVAAYDSAKFTTRCQEGLLALIESEKPDIVCFQEMSFASLSKIKPQLDSIYGPCETLKGNYQMWRLMFYSSFPLRNFRTYKCVGEISSDYMTMDGVAHIEQAQKQMNVMSAEFEVVPGRWMTLFSGQLCSSAYSTARRSMNEDTSWIEGIPLYKRYYDVGKRIRDYEARNVRRFVDDARLEGMPVIVAGDLNDWSGSDCLNTLMSDDLKDAWWKGGNGFGWTYFGWHLRLRLDHILYSDELELVDVGVIDTDLSDHKPLMARFKVK